MGCAWCVWKECHQWILPDLIEWVFLGYRNIPNHNNEQWFPSTLDVATVSKLKEIHELWVTVSSYQWSTSHQQYRMSLMMSMINSVRMFTFSNRMPRLQTVQIQAQTRDCIHIIIGWRLGSACHLKESVGQSPKCPQGDRFFDRLWCILDCHTHRFLVTGVAQLLV